MKYDKTLYGESDLFEMIDASEERSTNGVNISVALESKAVKEEEIKKSAKELEPFSSEAFDMFNKMSDEIKTDSVYTLFSSRLKSSAANNGAA